ncbi:Transposase DDE domain [Streptomyces sp. AmelKG-E11A]|nr:Transposase DDE domain [Streptomyces sp. AmelKG-E11A]
MSGSAGGRAEQDLPRQTPHRAADPTAWLHQFKRLRTRYEIRADLHLGLLQLACSIICLRRLRTSF